MSTVQLASAGGAFGGLRMKEQLTAPRKAPLILLSVCCAALLTGCGDSLNSEFALTPASTNTPLSAKGESPIAKLTGSNAKLAAGAADKLTSSATPGNTGYKIGPLDVLELSVFKVPELSRVAQVADTGTVNLPLVGEVQAAGKTAQEVERDLTKKLAAKYLKSPQVSILIKEYNSQRVTVEGAVKKPGVYPIRGKTTLLQAVAAAEGLDNQVSNSTVLVFRQIDGKRAAAKFDMAEIRSGAAEDPMVHSGDVIVAPNSAMKETFNLVLKALPLATVFALL
jgi:polysaccharide biosynthesis/export protein